MARETVINGAHPRDPRLPADSPPAPAGVAGPEPREEADELQVMRRLEKQLFKLPEPARGRCVRWLADKYADAVGA